MLKVYDTPDENCTTCEEDIVKLVDPRLVQRLSRENWVEAEEELHDNIKEILVKIVAN